MVDVGKINEVPESGEQRTCWPLAAKATAVAGLVIAVVALAAYENRQVRGGGNAEAPNPAAVIDEFAKFPLGEEGHAIP